MSTTEQKFDLEYFIKKFEAIPEDQWTTGRYEDDKGCKCAYGHCGLSKGQHCNKESDALDDITRPKTFMSRVNDNVDGNFNDFGSTPKQRVVNYLKSLR